MSYVCNYKSAYKSGIRYCLWWKCYRYGKGYVYIPRTTINSIVGSSKTAPGFNVIAKIGEISSPRISMEWLVRGVGDMFLDEKDSIKYQINSGSNITNSPGRRMPPTWIYQRTLSVRLWDTPTAQRLQVCI